MEHLSRSRKYLPLYIVLFYYVAVFVVYISDVLVSYPYKNDELLSAYWFVLIATTWLGYFMGVNNNSQLKSDPNFSTYAKWGFVLYLLMFYPSIYVYTGRSILEFGDLLLDPVQAYLQMQDTVSESRGARIYFLLLKVAESPLTVILIPYYMYQAVKLGKTSYRLIIVLLLAMIMSVFRGTDKEFFDIFILGIGSWIAAKIKVHGSLFGSKESRKRAFRILIILAIGLTIFGFRKSERMFGAVSFCFPAGNICVDLTLNGSASYFSLTVIMLAIYLTNGLYGLSCSLDAQFHTGFGFGHSPVLQYFASEVFGLRFDDNVVSQLNSLGWSTKGVWSSGLSWINNDIPIFLIPVLLFAIGYLFGLSWRQVVSRTEFLPHIIFVHLFYFYVFLPGNLQIAQSSDYYFGFLFWLTIYIVKNLSLVRRPKCG